MEKLNGVSKSIFLTLVLVSCFIFLITLLVVVFSLYPNGDAPELLRPVIEYHTQLMVMMAILGVSTGFFVYRTLNAKIEKQQKVIQSNMELIMRFLSAEEREILNLLNEKQGRTTQSEIAKLPGMSRLKAHRLIKKMEERRLIHIEKYGKINMIRIVDELQDNSGGLKASVEQPKILSLADENKEEDQTGSQ
ncbi:winged helix-turn-helix transcriptional regulator [Candidatus Micrarchaeota archaeon]|nr:winged helix-turn-helix transcriptional regulator [Candidatus Micrarchaeota archaeon]